MSGGFGTLLWEAARFRRFVLHEAECLQLPSPYCSSLTMAWAITMLAAGSALCRTGGQGRVGAAAVGGGSAEIGDRELAEHGGLIPSSRSAPPRRPMERVEAPSHALGDRMERTARELVRHAH